MRKALMAAIVAAGIGAAGSVVHAAPVSGPTIGNAAATLDMKQEVRRYRRTIVRPIAPYRPWRGRCFQDCSRG